MSDRTEGDILASERETDRLKARRKELEEAHRLLESETLEILKALEGTPVATARAEPKRRSINPSIQQVIDLLQKRACEMNAADVAKALDITEHVARQRLWKAKKTKQVEGKTRGRYAATRITPSPCPCAGRTNEPSPGEVQ